MTKGTARKLPPRDPKIRALQVLWDHLDQTLFEAQAWDKNSVYGMTQDEMEICMEVLREQING